VLAHRSGKTRLDNAFVLIEGHPTLVVSSHPVVATTTAEPVNKMQFIGDAIPGYSGGPVLDLDGRVVGVTVEGIPPINVEQKWQFLVTSIDHLTV
jgi:V8-like Glu-specific endopeptidase